MKKDSELAKLDTISPKDLLDKPMIISNQEMVKMVLVVGLVGIKEL